MLTLAIIGGAAATVGGLHVLKRYAKPGTVADRVYRLLGGGGPGGIEE